MYNGDHHLFTLFGYESDTFGKQPTQVIDSFFLQISKVLFVLVSSSNYETNWKMKLFKRQFILETKK
jgi:hypothetical protein